MENLIYDFVAETREMLEALSGEIVAWEAMPDDRDRFDAIFRFVHTVKGNCGFLDLPRLEMLSHAAEEVLAQVRAGKRSATPDLVSAVLSIIDRIGDLVNALETGESISDEDDANLISILRASARKQPQIQRPGIAPSPLKVRKSSRTVRISVDLLDQLMSGVSDMVLARNELALRLREAAVDAAAVTAFDRMSACITEMRDVVTRTRMQRIDNLFAGLPRFVRDLGTELSKQVALQIQGGDVELDREMIEMIRDPLRHIIRNAIDHGIEPAEERSASGKPPAGKIKVKARQSGNQILIEIIDDGRGIDGEQLARKAVLAGLIRPDQAEKLNEVQRLGLIFEPGLTTAKKVTSISGRGVGMDVVRANIERIGGVVDVESRLGEGARITLRVPLTLTIIPALTVKIGNQTYAIPRSAIQEIVRCHGSSVRTECHGGANIVIIRDNRLPVVLLSEVLEIPGEMPLVDQMLIVLKPAGGGFYALAVDDVHDHEELVVKPAAPVIMATGLYAGTTLMDDGKPILILDPSGIAVKARVKFGQEPAQKISSSDAADGFSEGDASALLFVDLHGRKRAIHLSVLERIEDAAPDMVKIAGGQAVVALDGHVLPLAGVDDVPKTPIGVLKLTDGRNQLAYGLSEVIDLVPMPAEIVPTQAPGEIGGICMIDGDQVEIVDPYWLFECFCGVAARDERPLCAFQSDDPWLMNILRPIVEWAGYKVVDGRSEDAISADILIVSAEADLRSAKAANILKIRSQAEPAGANDDSIYRYDRITLLKALSQKMPHKRKA